MTKTQTLPRTRKWVRLIRRQNLIKTLPFLVLVSCATGAFAQDAIDTAKACKDATTQPITVPQITGPLSGRNLESCNTTGLYYGVYGDRKNLAAALQCGWYQRTHPEAGNKAGDMFHGNGTLSMLYANGLGGATQSYDLAIRFACEMEDTDTDRRVKHLYSLKNTVPTNNPFDLCDDAYNRFSGLLCQSIAEELRIVGRGKEVESLVSKLTPAQKRLFEKLDAAEAQFEGVRTDNEIDMTGAMRHLFVQQDLARLRDQFVINLQRLSKGDIPQATPADVKNLDAELNAVYQRVMQSPASTFENTTVKPEGVRAAQRAWLPLRDAWMEFAKSAYPKLSADRVMAQIIRLRLGQLRNLPIDLR